MSICPLYISQAKSCFVKLSSNERLFSSLTGIKLPVVNEAWNYDCEGSFDNCAFKEKQQKPETTPEPKPEPTPEPKQEKPKEERKGAKVSIHKIENPYLVKADVLVYPANNMLNVDDVLLNRFSRGTIQAECEQIPKPIKMGHVYITTNGGENSQVKPKHIYHAVVAGESRLVNEEDIKTSVRKSLLLADQNNAANVVFIPCDCGTHDINDTARVQLASIKTYLQSNKESKLKNIFIVMEDEESFNTFEEYYNRIF
jgi:O-acetyl-ADP-ribose deacetylase (regulator of RNase III)